MKERNEEHRKRFNKEELKDIHNLTLAMHKKASGSREDAIHKLEKFFRSREWDDLSSFLNAYIWYIEHFGDPDDNVRWNLSSVDHKGGGIQLYSDPNCDGWFIHPEFGLWDNRDLTEYVTSDLRTYADKLLRYLGDESPLGYDRLVEDTLSQLRVVCRRAIEKAKKIVAEPADNEQQGDAHGRE
ncbi:hypothetical protein ACFL2D_01310 [Patescibacteria group bacterium]